MVGELLYFNLEKALLVAVAEGDSAQITLHYPSIQLLLVQLRILSYPGIHESPQSSS